MRAKGSEGRREGGCDGDGGRGWGNYAVAAYEQKPMDRHKQPRINGLID